MTVEDQSENSFSIPQVMLPRQPIFVGLVHTTVFVTPVASGAAGRANVGLCHASSLL